MSGLVTVTRVEMTPDLLTARVYLSVFGRRDPKAPLDRLEARKGLHPEDACLPRQVEV